MCQGRSKFFTCQQLHEVSTVITSILQMGNRGTERVSELPEVTQLVSGQIQTQAVWPPRPICLMIAWHGLFCFRQTTRGSEGPSHLLKNT